MAETSAFLSLGTIMRTKYSLLVFCLLAASQTSPMWYPADQGDKKEDKEDTEINALGQLSDPEEASSDREQTPISSPFTRYSLQAKILFDCVQQEQEEGRKKASERRALEASSSTKPMRTDPLSLFLDSETFPDLYPNSPLLLLSETYQERIDARVERRLNARLKFVALRFETADLPEDKDRRAALYAAQNNPTVAEFALRYAKCLPPKKGLFLIMSPSPKESSSPAESPSPKRSPRSLIKLKQDSPPALLQRGYNVFNK